MIGLFEWILKKFGGEEEWRFSSKQNKKTLEIRLRNPENQEYRPQRPFGKYLVVHFDNDELEVRVRSGYGISQASFYYTGKLLDEDGGAIIEGKYRTHLARRIIFFIIFGFYWLFVITFFGALLYKLAQKLLFPSQTTVGADLVSGSMDIGIMTFAAIGIFYGIALILKLVRKAERYGKDKIYRFLSNVCEN